MYRVGHKNLSCFLLKEYATSGRPVVVRNATLEWPAMQAFSFHFFR